jgi:parallel beta-helix repeat protein
MSAMVSLVLSSLVRFFSSFHPLNWTGCNKTSFTQSRDTSKVKAITALLILLFFGAPLTAFAASASISSVTNITVPEGNKAVFTANLIAGTTTSKYILTLTGATTAGKATAVTDFSNTLEYSVNNGTTYTSLASGGTTAALAIGITSFKVRVSTLADSLIEANETFTLTVAPSTGATGTAKIGTGTILDNSATPAKITYLAEDATRSGSVVMFTDHLNYWGQGFTGNFWSVGDGMTFSVNAATAGQHDVDLRYLNARGTVQTISIFVNNVKIKQTSLPTLANWDTWGIKTERLTLNAGVNTITYKFDTGDNGNININSISVTKVLNVLPSVNISAPTTGASYTAPASITLTATASDTDGTINSVQFYNGTTALGTPITTPPYTYTWTGVAAGTYSNITAKAIDNSLATNTSAAISVTVKAPNVLPSVNISAPTTGASYTAPASITLTATASDSDGTINSVQFYNGTTALGTPITTPPYTYTWTGVAAGTYANITAKAIDNNLATNTSAAISVTVVAALPIITAVSDCLGTQSVAEGGKCTFTVSLSNATPAVGSVFTLKLDNASLKQALPITTPPTTDATAGLDYLTTLEFSTDGGVTFSSPVINNSNVTIPAGLLSFKVRATTLADNIAENDEMFSLTLTSVSGATGSDYGLCNITNVNTAVSTALMPSASLQPVYTAVGTLPTAIANNSTINLLANTVYYGTLDISNKTGVTIQTDPSSVGQKAMIIPGNKIATAWTSEGTGVYSTPYASPLLPPLNVITTSGEMLEVAHWPQNPGGLISSTGNTTFMNHETSFPLKLPALPTGISQLPNSADLVGATVFYKATAFTWNQREITSWLGPTATLGAQEPAFPGDYALEIADTFYYLTNKRWMLSQAGAKSQYFYDSVNGKLFVIMPDASDPTNKIVIATAREGVNATSFTASTDVTIKNIIVNGAVVGINGKGSTRLIVDGVRVTNSAEDGIYIGNTTSATIKNSQIDYSIYHAINSFRPPHTQLGDDATSPIIDHNLINNTNYGFMPKRSWGGIVLVDGTAKNVTFNSIYNSSYIGIIGGKNANITDNVINGACLYTLDGGGIYVIGRTGINPDGTVNYVNTNSQILRNKVYNVTPSSTYAIYLDDFANNVTVNGNEVANVANGILIHSGFDNTLTGNVFSNYSHSAIYVSDNDVLSRGLAYNSSNNISRNNTFYMSKTPVAPNTHPPVVYSLNKKPGGTFDGGLVNSIITSELNIYYRPVTYDFATDPFWATDGFGNYFLRSAWPLTQDIGSTFPNP